LLAGCAEQQAEYYINQLSDPRSQVRLDASHALIQLGGPTVAPLIDRASDNTDSLQYIAAQILGQIGDRRAKPFLKTLIRDENRYVRERAVRALGQLDDPRVIPTLEEALFRDQVADVRGAAAWSLGNLRDTTAVAPLVRALEDTVAPVRQKALTALQFLWTSQAEEATVKALRDPDGSVRYVAAQMLGHHRTNRALDELFIALQDDNIWVRVESANALARIGDTTAVPPLERLFSEREGPDHEAAKEALHLLTGLNYAVAPE
jgi:HEAT repeat protein